MTDLSLVKKRDSLSGDSQDGEGVARSRLELLFDADAPRGP